MKSIFQYLLNWFRQADKPVLFYVTLLAAALIFTNYYFGLEAAIQKNVFPVKLIAWWIVFALAFGLPYLFYRLGTGSTYMLSGKFLGMLLLAPAIFALKVTANIPIRFSPDPGWNHYWNDIVYWPMLVVLTLGLIYFIWRAGDKGSQPFYGARIKGMNWRPYFLMLLIMAPLVAFASTRPAFLAVYPKIQTIEGLNSRHPIGFLQRLLFELAYGSDFITIEFFFRGFLILAFLKWAGPQAILPMACFYCTIHFGKPLAECISSYFGGLILGIVVYNTRSVYGGLMVHLGIAWMMEWGGYIGNSLG